MTSSLSLSSSLLYTAAFLSAATVAGHTQMAYSLVFPSLKTFPASSSKGVKAAKIGWMECNQGFVYMGLFCVKWANLGLTDVYDKAFIGSYAIAQIWTALAYFKAGMYEPMLPLLSIPALAGAGLYLHA